MQLLILLLFINLPFYFHPIFKVLSIYFLCFKLNFIVIDIYFTFNNLKFAEPRVLQVERKSVLKPDQAEFVLSEGMYIIAKHYMFMSRLSEW